MAYLYRKIVGGKPYYYLRISKRVKGKQAVKDIAYLGSDLSKLQSKLDKLPKKYKEEIRKGYRSIKRFIDSNYYLDKIGRIKSDPYLNLELLRNVEAVKLHFNKNFLKKDQSTIMDVYKSFLIDFAYNTASIEGNTITLKEAHKLLQENLTPKEKSPREIFDLQNTEKVFLHLLDENPEFDRELIIKIHDSLLENIDLRKGYRKHNIRVFKSHFEASPVQYVKTDMNLLFKWYQKHKGKLHPLVLAGLFHQKFEKIHPFSDGNGRTGRLILNYILLMNDYPPLIIQKKHRSEYLAELAKADKAGLDEAGTKFYKGLIEYLAGELVKSYWENFNI